MSDPRTPSEPPRNPLAVRGRTTVAHMRVRMPRGGVKGCWRRRTGTKDKEEGQVAGRKEERGGGVKGRDEGWLAEGQFRGKRKRRSRRSTFTGSVDSLLFCQTSERGPRPVPGGEGRREGLGQGKPSLPSSPSPLRLSLFPSSASPSSSRTSGSRDNERASRSVFIGAAAPARLPL